MPTIMRFAVLASTLAILFGHDLSLAQMVDTVPAIGATSPVGMTAGTPVPPTGEGMGATELPSAGLSPVPTASIGITGDGGACPALTSSPPGMSGTAATYDGGGMTMGTPSPGGMVASGTCDTSPTSAASASSAMATPSPGGASRVGIPMGSVEIGGSGLSPMPAGLAPSPMPLFSDSGTYPSMLPASSSSLPTISLPGPVVPATGTAGPCQSVGASGNPSTIAGC